MKDLDTLWQQRLRFLVKEIGKYGRLIMNDHFSVILFVILGFFMYFYREQLLFISTQPSELVRLPIIVTTSLLLASVSMIGRPIWLMKEADKSYVFPLGEQWRNYWLKGSLLGLVLPTLINGIVVGLIFPFLSVVTKWQTSPLLLLIFLQLLVIVAHHMQEYLTIFNQQLLPRWVIMLVYCVGLIIGLYYFTETFFFVALLLLIVLLSVIILRYFRTTNQWFDFEWVIQRDIERQSAFYKWIGFFAEVPNQLQTAKRRTFFDGLITRLSRFSSNRHYYLFLRLLFRNTTYSGVWLRVLFFISVLMCFTSNIYLVVGLGIVAFVMTVVQLLPMYHYYAANPFQIIYPNTNQTANRALQSVILIVLCIQVIVFALISLVSMGISLYWGIALTIWTISIFVIVLIYMPNWVKRNS